MAPPALSVVVYTSQNSLTIQVTAPAYTRTYYVYHSITGQGVISGPTFTFPAAGGTQSYTYSGLPSGTWYNVGARSYDPVTFEYGPQFTQSVPTDSPPAPPPSPPAPTINSPAAGATINYTTDNAFSWTASTAYGGQNYAYFMYRKTGTSTWTSIAISGGTQNYTLPANTLQPSTGYEWTVQTRCASYNTWSPNATVRAFTTSGAVIAPLITGPADNTPNLYSNPLSVTWTFRDPNVGQAQTKADTRYRNITDNGAWQELPDVAATEATLIYAAYSFNPDKQYEIQVRTYNSDGLQSPWSDSVKIYSIQPPPAPTALTPADTSTVQTSTPTLTATRTALPSWQPARFEWQFASDAAFTQDVVTYLQTMEKSAAGTVTDKLPTDKRLPQRDWYVRVRQLDTFGQYSPYATTVNRFVISHAPSTNTYSPTATVYLAASTANVFSWNFSDTSETDAQTAFQIILERNDTGVIVFDTGKVASSSKSYVRNLTTAPKDVVLRWRVRVWDTDDKASGFSAYQLFRVGDRPSITVTPGNESVVNSGAPTITWDLILGGTRYQTNWSVTFTDRITNQVVHAISGIDQSTRSYTPPSSILVNGRDYSIVVAISDSSGLANSATSNVHTQFDSPEVVVYIVDINNLDELGYALIDWSATQPDPDFINWKVYRRRSSLVAWELLSEISDITVSRYHDWAIESGSVYQYTVTQTVVRFGIILESPLGYRATWLPTPRVNLSTNPSADIGITDWSEFDGMGGTAEITRETNSPYIGQGFVRITYAVPFASTHSGGLRQAFDCTEGEVVTASAYVRQSDAVMLHAGFYNAGTAVIDVMKPDALTADEWVRVSVSVIVPAGVSSLDFVIYASAAVPANYTLDVDAVLIEATDTVKNYFDGYSSGAHWNNAVGLSTSTLDKSIVAESSIYRMDISHYWILNYVDPSANVKIPNVTADPYTDEWEENTYTLIGRGRKKDYGTHLGRTSTLTAQVRGYNGEPKVFRAQLDYLKELQATYYLRTPFGDLIPVALGNISYTPLAGTSLAEMFEVSIPYEEVAPGTIEDAGTTIKRPARMQVIDNGDGTLTLIPLAESDVSAAGGDIIEITL